MSKKQKGNNSSKSQQYAGKNRKERRDEQFGRANEEKPKPMQSATSDRPFKYPPNRKQIEPLTQGQAELIHGIFNHECVFGIGPAGTGKTYIIAATAADMLRDKIVKKIFITRPYAFAGKDIGALPGNIEEKFAPFARPVMEEIHKRLGSIEFYKHLDNLSIEAVPLEFCQGLSLDDCYIIFDEAQNSTPEQMKMMLTRTGENSIMAVDGDPKQKCQEMHGQISGLEIAVEMANNNSEIEAHVTEFTHEDNVRSGQSYQWSKAFDKRGIYG